MYLEASSEGEEPRAFRPREDPPIFICLERKRNFMFSYIPKEENKREAVVYVCAGSFWVPMMLGNTLRLTP